MGDVGAQEMKLTKTDTTATHPSLQPRSNVIH